MRLHGGINWLRWALPLVIDLTYAAEWAEYTITFQIGPVGIGITWDAPDGD